MDSADMFDFSGFEAIDTQNGPEIHTELSCTDFEPILWPEPLFMAPNCNQADIEPQLHLMGQHAMLSETEANLSSSSSSQPSSDMVSQPHIQHKTREKTRASHSLLESSQSETTKTSTRSTSTDSVSKLGRTLACPIFQFRKLHSMKHNCNGCPGRKLADVRTHLKSYHIDYLQCCRTCGEDVLSKDEFEACHGKNGEKCQGQLSRKRGGDAREVQWKKLYHKLCGAISLEVPSPFNETAVKDSGVQKSRKRRARREISSSSEDQGAVSHVNASVISRRGRSVGRRVARHETFESDQNAPSYVEHNSPDATRMHRSRAELFSSTAADVYFRHNPPVGRLATDVNNTMPHGDLVHMTTEIVARLLSLNQNCVVSDPIVQDTTKFSAINSPLSQEMPAVAKGLGTQTSVEDQEDRPPRGEERQHSDQQEPPPNRDQSDGQQPALDAPETQTASEMPLQSKPSQSVGEDRPPADVTVGSQSSVSNDPSTKKEQVPNLENLDVTTHEDDTLEHKRKSHDDSTNDLDPRRHTMISHNNSPSNIPEHHVGDESSKVPETEYQKSNVQESLQDAEPAPTSTSKICVPTFSTLLTSLSEEPASSISSVASSYPSSISYASSIRSTSPISSVSSTYTSIFPKATSLWKAASSISSVISTASAMPIATCSLSSLAPTKHSSTTAMEKDTASSKDVAKKVALVLPTKGGRRDEAVPWDGG
ncbi:hypothetical protein EJ04DRAFT_133052 [Polyplosphaeria fusca]|uniref:Uncharacterized protein n=1 Tax=Polyplosphaeria fusca TaxID=682080 RepID=A0A9P4QLG0_9PLEO|nr:hypothetical protein EJ04DRAFT_133052 [Polyplosphaeria fusca]